MNVLLTCAGRRNYLVRYFRESLGERGVVIAIDANSNAPALQVADRWFVLPPISDSTYMDRLLELCRKNEVRLVVPLNDLELPLLARERSRFERAGIVVLVSSPEVIRRSFDKWEMAQFFTQNGIPVPRTFCSLSEVRRATQAGMLHFPMVVKPRWGTASIGIHFPTDETELEMAYQFTRKQVTRSAIAEASSEDIEHCVIIQEYLTGCEYGLDVVNDLQGRYVTTFIRKKLGMRAGETDRAITCADPELQALGATIGRCIGHIGNLDCDVIRGPGTLGVLDINPRFGGGYPFVHVAGANLPSVLLAWVEGREIDSSWLKYLPGVTGAKYDHVAVVRNSSGACQRRNS